MAVRWWTQHHEEKDMLLLAMRTPGSEAGGVWKKGGAEAGTGERGG